MVKHAYKVHQNNFYYSKIHDIMKFLSKKKNVKLVTDVKIPNATPTTLKLVLCWHKLKTQRVMS